MWCYILIYRSLSHWWVHKVINLYERDKMRWRWDIKMINWLWYMINWLWYMWSYRGGSDPEGIFPCILGDKHDGWNKIKYLSHLLTWSLISFTISQSGHEGGGVVESIGEDVTGDGGWYFYHILFVLSLSNLNHLIIIKNDRFGSWRSCHPSLCSRMWSL